MTEKRHLKVVRHQDFYQELREKVREWAKGKGRGHRLADYILVGPDIFHLMLKLVVDERVPRSSKTKLGIAIAYFVSPLDIVPEIVLGPVGYLDDIALAAWVLDDIIKKAGPEVVLDHWAGDRDVLELIAKIISSANDLLGSGLVNRLKKHVNGQDLGPALMKEVGPARKLPPHDE